ncbi:MAG: EamA family transporter [Campylobacteraceae bacterium]|nr:EamA family transporter [Campylobacteraceae bacterium]
MNSKNIFLALLVALIWGINFPIIKLGLEELPPILFSALRFTIVAIPAVFFIPFPKTSVWNVLGVGVILGIFKFALLFFAMNADASAGLASLILQAQVFFTIFLSVIIFKEHISKNQLLGIFISSLGFSIFFLNAEGNITVLGLCLILLAAFFWAVSNIIMKKMKDVNLLHFMVWVCLIPPLPLFGISYYTESKDILNILLQSTQTTWFSLVYVSYISTLLAFALWAYLLKNNKAAEVTPFALLIPIVGLSASNIVLGERLSSLELMGAGIIMLGLLVCVFGKKLIKVNNEI